LLTNMEDGKVVALGDDEHSRIQVILTDHVVIEKPPSEEGGSLFVGVKNSELIADSPHHRTF